LNRSYNCRLCVIKYIDISGFAAPDDRAFKNSVPDAARLALASPEF
jgi:hypothetical protein